MPIRSAVELDCPHLSDIYNHYVENSSATFATVKETEEERICWWQSHLESGLPVIVLEEGGRILGFASLSFYHQRCAYRRTVEASVYLHKDAQGRGLGSLLFEHLLALAKEKGFHAVLGLICSENTASLKLVEKYGFMPVGLLRIMSSHKPARIVMLPELP